MPAFDLQPREPSGTCRFCHSVAPYAKSTCDNCGNRLPWADGDADTLGEPCPNPQCKTFNVYARRTCRQCSAVLPWHHSVAATYHARHDVEREFKSTMWMVLIVLMLTMFGLMGFAALSPHH